MLPPLPLQNSIDKIVREEWGRILAVLVKNLGDLQLAEDCLQDAFVSALHHWEKNGLPNSPAAWLITVARRKAIDRLRKTQNFAAKQDEIAYLLDLENQPIDEGDADMFPDKRLELMFTCCHPALEEKSQIALTLRTLCGLSTEEIASAFLDKPSAMQQRLTRAKKKIALAGIPYKVPDKIELPERLSSILHVIYLVFNEGYSASSGEALIRTDLCNEAIRLARIIHHLLPEETEITGLLALMLIHDSRRLSRTGPDGELIPLQHQNRNRWQKAQIEQGVLLLKETLPKQSIGPYQLQAAISAVHAQSATWKDTNWAEIAALYDLLYTLQPSIIVQINHAVAVSYASSVTDGLRMMDTAAANGKLARYQPYFAARADLLARSDNLAEAKTCYLKAIDLSENQQEAEFLRRKMQTL